MRSAEADDLELMSRLGLRTTDYGRDWTHIGTITEAKIAEINNGRPPRDGDDLDDRVKIEVEVSAMPALFWRFTVTRVNEETDEPETFVIGTGSNGTWGGNFTEYWLTAKYLATNMLSVERL